MQVLPHIGGFRAKPGNGDLQPLALGACIQGSKARWRPHAASPTRRIGPGDRSALLVREMDRVKEGVEVGLVRGDVFFPALEFEEPNIRTMPNHDRQHPPRREFWQRFFRRQIRAYLFLFPTADQDKQAETQEQAAAAGWFARHEIYSRFIKAVSKPVR